MHEIIRLPDTGEAFYYKISWILEIRKVELPDRTGTGLSIYSIFGAILYCEIRWKFARPEQECSATGYPVQNYINQKRISFFNTRFYSYNYKTYIETLISKLTKNNKDFFLSKINYYYMQEFLQTLDGRFCI